MIKVSILIPIYNVEKYIERCARSLFEQTMREGIEFIFTNDCTPDGSIAILEKVLNDYPERKPQVKIIHHNMNKGLVVARITGVNAARGEYVIHCDSDDWVEPNMYELLYAKAKETDADIVGCDFYEEYPTKRYINRQDLSVPQEKILDNILITRSIDGYLWNRLIKKEFYINGNFKAENNITMFEDMAITIPMHLSTSNVGYINKPLYHYRKIRQSMSNNLNVSSILSAIAVLEKILKHDALTVQQKNAIELSIINMGDALICHKPSYAPTIWREQFGMISNKPANQITHSISKFLVNNNYDFLNYLFIAAKYKIQQLRKQF